MAYDPREPRKASGARTGTTKAKSRMARVRRAVGNAARKVKSAASNVGGVRVTRARINAGRAVRRGIGRARGFAKKTSRQIAAAKKNLTNAWRKRRQGRTAGGRKSQARGM